MVRALLTFAADDPSKAPFYIAGVLLAVWAVVLAFLGLSRASFPGGRTGERAVIGISVFLAAATVAMAVITASTEKPEKKRVVEAGAVKPAAAAPKVAAAGGTAAPPAATAAPLALAADPTGNLRFDRKTLSAKAGKVTIDFTNKSQVGHDVVVAKGATKIGGTPIITNSQASLNVNLKPGQYVFYCSVPGHRQAGMQGTLTVT